MIIQGMYGLGDNFYQRAIIRNLGECYLYTPWPEVYADLPVKCLKPQTQLRTQEKNINRGDSGRFHSGALGGRKIRLCYDQRGTIIEALEQSIGVKFERLDLSMPDLKKKRKPKILVRPCVVRSEWPASSRNCNPQYIQQAVDALKDEFTIVSIADLEPGKEWLEGEEPFAHEKYHAGELSFPDIMTLLNECAGTIGSVGWILPASMAYRVPHLSIFGGWGSANGEQRVFDDRLDSSMVIRAVPDNFCMCSRHDHKCDKTISNFGGKIEDFKRLAKSRL